MGRCTPLLAIGLVAACTQHPAKAELKQRVFELQEKNEALHQQIEEAQSKADDASEAAEGAQSATRAASDQSDRLESKNWRDVAGDIRDANDIAIARSWLAQSGGALDGVVAKRLDEPYRAGERAMLKVKQHRTADCVVGGFRRADGGGVASLLLGLYDDAGRLDHVGFPSGIATGERIALLERLEPLVAAPGFTGKAPGGPSRWNDGKESAGEPLRSELVVEVVYDQVTGQRFRHGTRLLRWRPDKAPPQCRMDQLVHELRPAELATLDQ